jgi:UDP-glucose 4-epimerase
LRKRSGGEVGTERAREHDGVIIDNLATGRRENVEHLLDNPRVTVIKGSITDLNLLAET